MGSTYFRLATYKNPIPHLRLDAPGFGRHLRPQMFSCEVPSYRAQMAKKYQYQDYQEQALAAHQTFENSWRRALFKLISRLVSVTCTLLIAGVFRLKSFISMVLRFIHTVSIGVLDIYMQLIIFLSNLLDPDQKKSKTNVKQLRQRLWEDRPFHTVPTINKQTQSNPVEPVKSFKASIKPDKQKHKLVLESRIKKFAGYNKLLNRIKPTKAIAKSLKAPQIEKSRIYYFDALGRTSRSQVSPVVRAGALVANSYPTPVSDQGSKPKSQRSRFMRFRKHNTYRQDSVRSTRSLKSTSSQALIIPRRRTRALFHFHRSSK